MNRRPENSERLVQNRVDSRLLKFTAVLLTSMATSLSAEVFICSVNHKVELLDGFVYPTERLLASQFEVRIDTSLNLMSRCSVPPYATQSTCDVYHIDHTERSQTSLSTIIKYYYLNGQYDVQVFGDGKFIENNGRGGLASGVCVKV